MDPSAHKRIIRSSLFFQKSPKRPRLVLFAFHRLSNDIFDLECYVCDDKYKKINLSSVFKCCHCCWTIQPLPKKSVVTTGPARLAPRQFGLPQRDPVNAFLQNKLLLEQWGSCININAGRRKNKTNMNITNTIGRLNLKQKENVGTK